LAGRRKIAATTGHVFVRPGGGGGGGGRRQGHCEAVGRGDFDAAYSCFFGPTYRGSTDEGRWIADEESQVITGSTVHSVEVGEVFGGAATADGPKIGVNRPRDRIAQGGSG